MNDSRQIRPMILGVPFDALTLPEALERSRAALAGDRIFHVVTAGPEFVMTSRHHAQFCDVLQRADLSLPEGMGIVLASKVLGQPKLHRIVGMSYVEALLGVCAEEGDGVFFFGAMPGVGEEAVQKLLPRFPGLIVAGIESGFRSWLRVPEAYIAWRIRKSGAKVVLVALGAPEQELWIDRNRHRLGEARIAVGVGGAFDFWSERVRRAPVFLQKLGLEWSWRLAQEPKKRWRRIMTATWAFTKEVMREKRRTTHV